MMSLVISTVAARDSRVMGSARASRAVSGALAGNSLEANDSMLLTPPFGGFTVVVARRGRCTGHARRVRSPIV